MSGPAILLMAYGAPERLDQVEAYYTDIRRGSPPPPHLLEELIGRYTAIGGGSPLSRIVERQRAALEAELARRGRAVHVYAGMKHIAPFIGDVVSGMVADGADHIVAIALAPQHSSFNEQTYARAVEEAAAASGRMPRVTVVGSWHDQPRLIEALAAATREALARCDDPGRAHVFFTAHSLPERIAGGTDPYAHEVAATAALVAEACGLERCDVAFQSAGRTSERWIGPELLSEIRRVAAVPRARRPRSSDRGRAPGPEGGLCPTEGSKEAAREIVVCPVGFVADHLEVLYDIDVEARALARELGVRLERARSMNDDPTFIAALAEVATSALAQEVTA